MTPKEKFQSLRHLILETPLDKQNICELETKCDLYADPIEQALTELEELKRYPTSEEVCKALSEFFQSMPLYADIENVHYSVEHKKFYNNDYVDMLELISDHFYFEDLPPHLITLIGRFYQGLGK